MERKSVPQIQEDKIFWREWAEKAKGKIEYTNDLERGAVWNGALHFLSGLDCGASANPEAVGKR